MISETCWCSLIRIPRVLIGLTLQMAHENFDWMDEMLLSSSSYNPYKAAADLGHQRRKEKKRIGESGDPARTVSTRA